MYEPKGTRDAEAYRRLLDLAGEGLQLLEHSSLI
jgi:hypothetical protein